MPPVPQLMPALVTPFDPSGEIDLAAHKHNLSMLWDIGIRGFLIGGSTGEGPYLEAGERRSLMEGARSALGPEAYLVCGIAAETVRQGLAMIGEVGEAADAAMVVTPTTLTRNRPQYVEGFYNALAERSPLPLYLYSVPAVTAYELAEDLVARLARHPRIVGIKDSGGHPVRLQRIVSEVQNDLRVFTGSTAALTLAITAGAYGAITASTNYMSERLLATMEAARSNPHDARALQTEVTRIAAAVEAHGIPGVKYAAARWGLEPGYPRQPLAPLADQLRPALDEVLG